MLRRFQSRLQAQAARVGSVPIQAAFFALALRNRFRRSTESEDRAEAFNLDSRVPARDPTGMSYAVLTARGLQQQGGWRLREASRFDALHKA